MNFRNSEIAIFRNFPRNRHYRNPWLPVKPDNWVCPRNQDLPWYWNLPIIQDLLFQVFQILGSQFWSFRNWRLWSLTNKTELFTHFRMFWSFSIFRSSFIKFRNSEFAKFWRWDLYYISRYMYMLYQITININSMSSCLLHNKYIVTDYYY